MMAPEIGQAGVVVKVVVFAIMGGWRFLGFGEQQHVAGLQFCGQFGATRSELLRAAKIVHGGAIGVLGGG